MGKLTDRITTRIDEDQDIALQAYMDDEGIRKESEVVRMALTHFLRAKGYLTQKGAQKMPEPGDKLAEAQSKAQQVADRLKKSGSGKVAASRDKEK